MKKNPLIVSFLLLCCVVSTALARVLDDFNGEQKQGWEDFTFQPGFGVPFQEDGQLKFVQPAAGTSIFSASTKVSETFVLQEGRRIVFSVDVISTNGADAFAAVSFIPKASSVGQLAGYSVAKSATDFLLVKGINKYFYNEHVRPEIKNENITLVMELTVKNGSVRFVGRVLDKDNDNAVLFEQTAIDTPAADPLADGVDSPAAPYLGEGNFVLLCYQDDGTTQETYEVIYDNAEVYILDEVVVDDFNDNTKTQWEDFSFQEGFGIPTEAQGRFRFAQPAAGSSIFSASTKITPEFELVEGEQLQFRVDLVNTNGPDAFAVLSFIPISTHVSQLAGYSIAVSSSDVLLTKGINKYFYTEPLPEDARANNVRLALTLTVKEGNVIITGQILDIANNDAVLFEYTAVDTSGADSLASGTDDPAAPYLGRGRFALLCYQNGGVSQTTYEVTFDNAIAWRASQLPNAPPILTEVEPAPYRNFLPPTTQIRFKVTDDQPLEDDKISVTLNGQLYTASSGLTLDGQGETRTVSLGGLQSGIDYVAILRVEDVQGAVSEQVLRFDTFPEDSFVIEVEDYNFEGGRFWDNPVPIPEGSGPQDESYSLQYGYPGIDYHDTRTNYVDVPYRPSDTVRMARTLDYTRAKFGQAGGAEEYVFDYAVGDFQPGEWMNYTRTFPSGTYAVYLRQSVGNMDQYTCVLEEVTSDPSEENQTTRPLGTFRGFRTGFQYGNVLLTNAAGTEPVLLTLEGVKTLRLRQTATVASDAQVAQNYLVFVRQGTSAPPVGSLVITAVTTGPVSDEVILKWVSEPGKTYLIEVSPDLSSGSWAPLVPAYPSQGTETSFTDKLPEGTHVRFYRVSEP